MLLHAPSSGTCQSWPCGPTNHACGRLVLMTPQHGLLNTPPSNPLYLIPQPCRNMAQCCGRAIHATALSNPHIPRHLSQHSACSTMHAPTTTGGPAGTSAAATPALLQDAFTAHALPGTASVPLPRMPYKEFVVALQVLGKGEGGW